jgi:hypothetical protein
MQVSPNVLWREVGGGGRSLREELEHMLQGEGVRV